MASSPMAPPTNAEAASSAAPTITAEAAARAAAARATAARASALPQSPGNRPRPRLALTVRTKRSKRSRSGCFTCRLRRKKCDEDRPACKTCLNLGLRCEYRPPLWWSTGDQRRRQRERLRDRIRQTKLMQREGALQEYVNRIRELATRPAVTQDLDFNLPIAVGQAPVMSGALPSPVTPGDVTVTTNQQTFINNTPVPQVLTASNLNPLMGPPQMLNLTPSPELPAPDWLRNLDGSYSDKPLSSTLHSWISVEDKDRELFDHFVDNVLKVAFPVLELYRGGPARITEVLSSMQNNRSYLHCCLSAAAVHLKLSNGMEDQMDHDIVQHRWSAISSLSRALGRGSGRSQVMDATLALIFYNCSVGPSDDYLPDVDWDIHFSAVSNLVKRLGCMPSQFNVTLISWIDILGSAMLGRTPEFSHTYRTKHLSLTPSGLEKLMGCDDRIMYLIAEAACLESLKKDGIVDNLTIFRHVSALNIQLNWTEPEDPTLQSPYGPSGAVRPEMLTKITSAIFRVAARLYLLSIIPGFDHFDTVITNQVASAAEILQYLPTGPNGYDRCLAWPLFIIGAYSVPSSSFRRALTERVAAMGTLGDFGSFGRMYRLLREVWRVSNQTPTTPTIITTNAESEQGEDSSEDTQSTPQQSQPATIQQVHWRDVMQDRGWNFLLM